MENKENARLGDHLQKNPALSGLPDNQLRQLLTGMHAKIQQVPQPGVGKDPNERPVAAVVPGPMLWPRPPAQAPEHQSDVPKRAAAVCEGAGGGGGGGGVSKSSMNVHGFGGSRLGPGADRAGFSVPAVPSDDDDEPAERSKRRGCWWCLVRAWHLLTLRYWLASRKRRPACLWKALPVALGLLQAFVLLVFGALILPPFLHHTLFGPVGIFLLLPLPLWYLGMLLLLSVVLLRSPVPPKPNKKDRDSATHDMDIRGVHTYCKRCLRKQEPFMKHCVACGRCVRDRVCHSHVLRVCVPAQSYECYCWLVAMCASQNLLLAAYQSLLAFAELVEQLLDMPQYRDWLLFRNISAAAAATARGSLSGTRDAPPLVFGIAGLAVRAHWWTWPAIGMAANCICVMLLLCGFCIYVPAVFSQKKRRLAAAVMAYYRQTRWGRCCVCCPTFTYRRRHEEVSLNSLLELRRAEAQRASQLKWRESQKGASSNESALKLGRLPKCLTLSGFAVHAVAQELAPHTTPGCSRPSPSVSRTPSCRDCVAPSHACTNGQRLEAGNVLAQDSNLKGRLA